MIFQNHVLNSSMIEEAIQAKVLDYTVTEILEGNGGTITARVQGRTASKHFSVFVKVRHGGHTHNALWYLNDMNILDREYVVYGLLETFNVPHAQILASCYENANRWTLILEDLAERCILPTQNNQLDRAALSMIVKSYAKIHSASLTPRNQMKLTLEKKILQVEEGAQVDETSAQEIYANLKRYFPGLVSMDEQSFMRALHYLESCRKYWINAPRVLVYNDFHVSNLALPINTNEAAILFDWELAGLALPQFDIVNICYGNYFNCDNLIAEYIELSNSYGTDIDSDQFYRGIEYAKISMNFYALWLTHLRLQAGRRKAMPAWMLEGGQRLLNGELLLSAERAIRSIDT